MSLSFFLGFLYTQWFITPPPQTQSYEGQTIIVTGANVGLGLEAARMLVKLGAEKVIIAVRSIEKGEDAKRDIEKTTGKKGVVEVWQLDLGSYKSVEEFAERASKLGRLDVLLENAGIGTQNYKLAEDNESTITVNVVSTYLLGLLLLPTLKASARKYNKKTYLTIVSSEVHFMTQVPYLRNTSRPVFDILNDKSTANMPDRYNVSKLLEVFSSRQMVKEYMSDPDYPVITNFLTPGLCHSQLMREMALLGVIMKYLMGARTTEVGARTLVHATHAGEESHGKYLSDCAVREPAPLVLSEQGQKLQEKVWSELKEKLEKIHPGILKNF
ncbi:NAD(P)-binding protein [Tothia fuscella]|uniref:NAD(P)-binding protein n=1 Tax=Tothia fuscella TaxID=1048955 RepID=A0A9P4NND9_9PEZI|nr:NAD(P)-binding protein [Tothia fuscella]